MVLLKKIVVIAALNGDYKMMLFPVITRIISKANKIKLLKAYCFNCHKDALFSLHMLDNNEQISKKKEENFKPVCRECYKLFSIERYI